MSEQQRELPRLTGDVLYHLRTAHECVAYHLVWLDPGSPFDRSQFPMVPVGKEADWQPTAKRLLPGVSPANLERVRVFQPFAGCTWTAHLTTLSNDDKHRHPIKVAVGTGAEFTFGEMTVVLEPDDADRYIVDTATVLVAQTHDGRPLHRTLSELVYAVNDALVGFSEVLPGPRPSSRSAES